MSSNFKIKLNRSRSADSLSTSSNHYVKREKSYDRFCDYFDHDNHLQSDSSQEICVVIDDSDISSIDKEHLDSGVTNTSRFDDASLSSLDRKINKLNHMLQEQHLLLKELKEDLIGSNVLSNSLPSKRMDLKKDSFNTLENGTEGLSDSLRYESGIKISNDLNVVKNTEIQKLEMEIRQALTEFLQSDDLKDRIASATADSVKSVISTSFSTVFPRVYLPIMEQCQRRLLRRVTRTLENAFNGLEAGSASLFKSMHKIIRNELDKHQVLLEENKSGDNFDNFQNMLQVVLNKELKDWREKLQGVLLPQLQKQFCEDYDEDTTEPISPISPPQPVDPERSIIDQLMKTAEINKYIKDGDINKSFEEALSSADLSLVMAACKAADLSKVFSTPCCLKQCVLLSLVQQLATDMVHDTQLKCRYLEEAIINLNTLDPTTRMHLPLVVGEVRKHLSRFLRSFPSHFAHRRITLIIMAANNLLK